MAIVKDRWGQRDTNDVTFGPLPEPPIERIIERANELLRKVKKMPHSKSGKEIKIGSLIKGPNVSGTEFIGKVHNMRTGQKCSGDAAPLVVFRKFTDGTTLVVPVTPYFNEAFDADQVEVID